MPRKLKVFGTILNECSWVKGSHRQTRGVVATTSLTAALKAFNEQWHHVSRPYIGETGNAVEIDIAMSAPGTVFAAQDNNYGPRDFRSIADWLAVVERRRKNKLPR